VAALLLSNQAEADADARNDGGTTLSTPAPRMFDDPMADLLSKHGGLGYRSRQ
jgi:hypothetical protein